MSKHTPTSGPWTAVGREVRSADGKSVAWCGSFPEEEAIQNARLIAAQRDLLDALVLLVAEDEQDAPYARDSLKQARAAIRKATGGTKP